MYLQVHGDDPSRVARAFVSIHVADVNDNVSESVERKRLKNIPSQNPLQITYLPVIYSSFTLFS